MKEEKEIRNFNNFGLIEDIIIWIGKKEIFIDFNFENPILSFDDCIEESYFSEKKIILKMNG